jgi:hypothetical protein
MERLRAHMEIATGGAQILMAEEELDAPQIHTGLQQVRRERMPEGISTLLIIRR